MRHGILSFDHAAGGERLEDWHLHRSGMHRAFQPCGSHEVVLVDNIALNRWLHAGLQRTKEQLVQAQVRRAALKSRSDLEARLDSLPENERRWVLVDAEIASRAL